MRSPHRHARPIAAVASLLFLILSIAPLHAQETPLVGPNANSWSLPSEGLGPIPATPEELASGYTGANIPLGSANEPTIAVDPNNGMHVAVSAFMQIRVSIDGGTTFLAAVTAVLPAGFSSDGDASLGYDSQGRLFWAYLGRNTAPGRDDIFIARCDPTTGAIMAGYPVNVTAGAGLPSTTAGNNHDKEWLAVDVYASSPHRDNLYIAWTQFPTGSRMVWATRSTDQGATWSAATRLTPLDGSEGFPWPTHNTVAPNGDVYVSYHSLTVAGGTDGQVFICRSTDGGLTYPQKALAYGPGAADVTLNTGTGNIPGTRFWLQGTGQAWVLADPNTAGRIYVVANDDPDNTHGSGDDANVYIRTSTDNGMTWSASARVDHGPGTTFQVMPTATIDPHTGCIMVHWYDNRSGATNGASRFLLDVYSTSSHDGGVAWTSDAKINDTAFDPDPGAPFRFPGVTRIGEYNGSATLDGIAHADWTGNTFSGATPVGQQMVYGRFSIDAVPPMVSCPANLTVNSCAALTAADPAIAAFLAGASVTDDCDRSPSLSNNAPESFALGSTTVVDFTGTDKSGNVGVCHATVKVIGFPVSITCPASITVECKTHSGTPGTDAAIAAFLAGATFTDPCDPAPTITTDAPATFPKGTTHVTFTLNDSYGNSATCMADVRVVDTKPPMIACPAAIQVECNDHCLGGGVPDTDPAIVAFLAGASAADDCDPAPVITDNHPACFGLGDNIVTFTATDHSTNQASCNARVRVVDTTPPVITVTLDRCALWPPNHKMATINATVVVTDVCDPAPTFVLTSIMSNEPENGMGDGDTAPDIMGAATGTPDVAFQLRSERGGRGNGRRYTIVYTAMDMSGNKATATVYVLVPHDQSAAVLCSAGLSADGAGFAPGATWFALVVPSVMPSTSGVSNPTEAGIEDEYVVMPDGPKPQITPLFGGDIDVTNAYVGNSRGAIRPIALRVYDVNQDGLGDAVLFYPVAETQVLISGSAVDDGPVSLHFQTLDGGQYLAGGIFTLGSPMDLPDGIERVPVSRDPGGLGAVSGGSTDASASNPATTAEPAAARALPRQTGFEGIYPNPFGQSATVAFDLAVEGEVRLAVYDLRGALVQTLRSGWLAAGRYNAAWDGRDRAGRGVPGGVYLVRFEAGGRSLIRKAVLMK